MTFYDEYFAAQGWKLANIDSEISQGYSNSQFLIKLGLRPPLEVCSNVADEQETYRRCLGREIRRSSGRIDHFVLTISPD